MAVQSDTKWCYQVPDSKPPVCGVHQCRMVYVGVKINGKTIECWRCMVREQVVDCAWRERPT